MYWAVTAETRGDDGRRMVRQGENSGGKREREPRGGSARYGSLHDKLPWRTAQPDGTLRGQTALPDGTKRWQTAQPDGTKRGRTAQPDGTKRGQTALPD